MKIILLISLFSICVMYSRAGTLVQYFRDTYNPGKCVGHNLILGEGKESDLLDSCGKMVCGHDGLAAILTCGEQEPPGGYRLGWSLYPNSPYPECCFKTYVRNY